MTSYRLSHAAKVALRQIARHIGADRPASVQPVIDALVATFVFLSQHPKCGHEVATKSGLCRIFPGNKPAHKYVIAFYVDQQQLVILAVVHGARDWPRLLREMEKDTE